MPLTSNESQLGAGLHYDIFLSYSEDDSAWAARLYHRLRRYRVGGRRLEIFLATVAVTAGESIPHALTEALENSRHVVLVMSPAWLSSEWTRLEEEAAIWRDPSGRRRVILPLLLKSCRVPVTLQRLKFVDFRLESNFESSLRQLVETLRRIVPRSAESTFFSQQREAILNEPILPWLGSDGPSFDFLWPEMIIDPLVRTRRHPGPGQRLSEWVKNRGPVGAACVAIVGEPGAGKTTAMRSLMLSGGSGLLPERRLFLHARDLAGAVDTLLATARDDDDPLGVVVDGLDEAGSDRMPEIAIALKRLADANVGTLLASRADFFDRQYGVVRDGLSNLSEVIELASWHDDEILGFTAHYSAQIDQEGLTETVQRLLSRGHGSREMLGNPMRLTLLLYLIATGAHVDQINMHEPYSLYDTFYREWIREERDRGTGGFNPETVRTAHTELAHWLNEYKGEVAAPFQVLAELGEQTVERLLSDTAFYGLLTLTEDYAGNPIVTSFRHVTIGEFLIARDILEAFAGSLGPLQRALRVTVGHSVNTFVRSGFHVVSRPTVRRYLANLTGIYQELLPGSTGAARGGHGISADQAERLRQQIVYYIGRMPLDTFPDVLRQAFREESTPMLRRAAALSAMLHGDVAIEQEYMARLDQPDEALLNRSVQLAYFGDVHGDLFSFVDRGEDWSRCRAAIYQRFEGDSERDIRLRWWDIKTLRSFYSNRHYKDMLTPYELHVLDAVSLTDPSSEERSQAMRREHHLLVSELGLDAEQAG